MKKDITFEEAYTRLKEIHDLLQSRDMVDIDQIMALQKESKELYVFLDNIMKKNADTADMESMDE